MPTLHEHLGKILKDYPLTPEQKLDVINKIVLMLDAEGFYVEQEYYGCGC